ncbi:MAG: sulfotransferase domain-containing protein [bacterium]
MGFKDWFKKDKYGQPIVVVSGLPRSGTSMLMKMLEAGGVEIVTDGKRTADDDNPKGYYELEKVKTLDKGLNNSWLREFRGRAIKIISYFLESLPDNNKYKVIFIDRNIEEVMASQNKMLANRNKPVPEDEAAEKLMIRNFEKHLRKIKNTVLKRPWFDVLYINHNDILKGPQEEARKINSFLGGKLNEEKMACVVDPDLYRNRK